ncbi:MAG: BtrH N-terminal domain-containing protein [Thermodesulfobacteriota bacterium]|nr:BtrH N-terminal domain-containing protein [Thermodesulfobacteriota bacterium]
MHILDWNNITGIHCGSVAIRNVINYFGVDYKEEVCFGLGCGMGFFYSRLNNSQPSEVIHLRAPNMEPNFFNNEEDIYSWKLETNSREAHNELKKNLKLDLPVFLQTDLFYLEYYHSKIHFPGHVVVCIGFDEKKKIFFVSDTNFKEIQTVSFSDMDKARSSRAEPYPLSYNWFVVEKFEPFKNLNKKIENSICLNSQNYVKGQSSPRGTSSLFTLLEWIENLDKWIDLKDSQLVFRFAYQVIAKRGSQGGGFRYIYEEFLKFAESESSKINKLKLSNQMHNIAKLWEKSALLMKQISDKKNRKDLVNLKKTLSNLYSLEYEYHSKVLDVLGSKKKGA